MNKELLKEGLMGIVMLAGLDFVGFGMWVVSGQALPEGWLYLGSLTAHALRFILKVG